MRAPTQRHAWPRLLVGLALALSCAVGLAGCDEEPAPSAAPPEPGEAAGAPSTATMGVTPAGEAVPPAPRLALELRLTERDAGEGARTRTTELRLERGVLRVRTRSEPAADAVPDFDSSVVLDDDGRADLAAALTDDALAAERLEIAEPPEGGRSIAIAAVLERDGVRTRFVVEDPTSTLGRGAADALRLVTSLARRLTAPPEPPTD